MKLRKTIDLALADALAALTLSSCGGNSSAGTSGSQSTAGSSAGSAGASTSEPVTVKLGIVGGINEDLWAPA